MPDEDKKVTQTDEGTEGGKNSDDGGKNDAPDSSYQKLKVEKEDLEKRMKAIENQSAAERRKLTQEIDELKSKTSTEPKQDTERIVALELALARSTAVSKFGLSEDDAALLKGTPDEILKDAEYWAERLKENKAVDNSDSNKDMIDKKVDEAGNKKGDGNSNRSAPKPKGTGLSWMEKYKQATPGERARMDKEVMDGDVNPKTAKY